MKEIVNLYDWRGVKLGSYRCIILFEAVRHYQCDQITKFCVIFRKLQQWTFVQKYNIFARVGLKACQMLNKAFLNGLRLNFFANMVTLVINYLIFTSHQSTTLLWGLSYKTNLKLKPPSIGN